MLIAVESVSSAFDRLLMLSVWLAVCCICLRRAPSDTTCRRWDAQDATDNTLWRSRCTTERYRMHLFRLLVYRVAYGTY